MLREPRLSVINNGKPRTKGCTSRCFLILDGKFSSCVLLWISYCSGFQVLYFQGILFHITICYVAPEHLPRSIYTLQRILGHAQGCSVGWISWDSAFHHVNWERSLRSIPNTSLCEITLIQKLGVNGRKFQETARFIGIQLENSFTAPSSSQKTTGRQAIAYGGSLAQGSLHARFHDR